MRTPELPMAGIAARLPVGLDCAQLMEANHAVRALKIGETATGGYAHKAEGNLKSLICLKGETRKLARTQCLTSAAYRRCSHPNSFALFSPIPIRFSRLLAST